NGFNGVTFIATCTTGPTCGGGFIIGGTGSNTPTVTLSAPTTAQTGFTPATFTPPNAQVFSNPAYVLLYQDPAHADTSNGANNGNSTIGGGAGVVLNPAVLYTPATTIRLTGNINFSGCTEFIAGAYVISGAPTMA